MTRDERLREALVRTLEESVVRNDRIMFDDEKFKHELAARGLAVVEIGEPSVFVTSPECSGHGSGDVPTGNEGKQTAHPSSQSDIGIPISDREQAIARVLAGHSWDEWRFDMESEGDYPHMSREDWIEHEAARESLRERARAVIAAEDAVGRRG